MNGTLAAKLAHTGFKSGANLGHVLCFWKLVTEVKSSDQVLNSNIHLNIHNSLYLLLVCAKVENNFTYLDILSQIYVETITNIFQLLLILKCNSKSLKK